MLWASPHTMPVHAYSISIIHMHICIYHMYTMRHPYACTPSLRNMQSLSIQALLSSHSASYCNSKMVVVIEECGQTDPDTWVLLVDSWVLCWIVNLSATQFPIGCQSTPVQWGEENLQKALSSFHRVVRRHNASWRTRLRSRDISPEPCTDASSRNVLHAKSMDLRVEQKPFQVQQFNRARMPLDAWMQLWNSLGSINKTDQQSINFWNTVVHGAGMWHWHHLDKQIHTL